MCAQIRPSPSKVETVENPPQRVVLSDRCVHRQIGEHVFIVMPDSTLHHLDTPTAHTLWNTIRRAAPAGASVEDLTAALVAGFEVDPETARRDATRVVAALLEGGVVVPSDGLDGGHHD